MPLKKKNKKSYNQDVSLNDFANSNFISCRPKKGSGVIKQEVMKTNDVDWNWDDDVDDDIDLIETENEDGTKSIVIAKSSNVRKIQGEDSNAYNGSENAAGIEYPIAIWFLVSDYIPPEDVGRFAGICKATLFVTSYAKFWYNLYRRYCKRLPFLPERLKPECLAKRYGLRTLVIRSLYYSYEPFIKQHPLRCDVHETPKDLIKRRCISMWYQRHKEQWVFYFKLKLVYRELYRTKPRAKLDCLTILDDITANMENDCKVLKVFCGSFSSAPPTMGMILKTLQTSLSQNLRNHRLTLGFSSGFQDLTVGTPECFVVLENVVKTQVIDWWRPPYPHSEDYLPSPTLADNKQMRCSFSI